MDRRTRSAALACAGAALLCAAAVAPARAAACGPSVTVAAGDTLAGIASRCGSNVEALLRANPQIGDPRLLQLGQRLRLPAAGQAPTAQERPVRAANRDGLTTDGYRPPARGVQGLLLTPRSGPPGTTVTIEVMGVPPGPAVLGAGLQGADWQRLARIQVPDSGRVSVALAVPAWAGPGDTVVFLVQPAEGPSLGSGSFRVLAPSGPAAPADPQAEVTATGRLRQAGDCMLLETVQGHRYALAGDWAFTPGAEVTLVGRPADTTACAGARGSIEVLVLRPPQEPEDGQ